MVSSMGIGRIVSHGKDEIIRNVLQQIDLYVKDDISKMKRQADLLREMDLVRNFFQYRNRTGRINRQYEKRLHMLFGIMDLTLFRIRDTQGKVLFRESMIHFDDCKQCPPPLGFYDALKGRDINLVARENGSWLVLWIVPVKLNKNITGTVTLGFALDTLFLKKIASGFSRYEFDMSLGSLDGIYASSLPPDKMALLNRKTLTESIILKAAIIDDQSEENRLYYYDLLRIVDFNFGIVIGIDSSRVNNLHRSAKNIVVITLSVLFFAILLMALVFLVRLFRPLRSLRERVEKTAADISGLDINADTGDEIMGVVEAFNHMEEVLKDRIEAQDKIEISFMKAKNDALEAKKTAEDASRAKSKFLANMSHEIRTPMNGIIGITDLLLEMRMGFEQRILLSMVKKSSENLLKIINDILDISRIESGKFSLSTESFKLRKLIDDTVKLLAINAHNKELEISYLVDPDIPDDLLGDPGRLRQVLINIIGNAVKFTEFGSVMVTVTKVHQVSGDTGYLFGGDEQHLRLQFKVEDTGIGISEENSRIIFDTFIQGDLSYSRSYGGTGLGLTISSQLVTLMGGKIWLESIPGEGSCFFFSAEFISDSPSSSRWESPLMSDDIRNTSVLIYDPYRLKISAIEEMLNRYVSRIFCSSDEELILNELEKNEYDYCIINEKVSSEKNDLVFNKIVENKYGERCKFIVLISSIHQPGRFIADSSIPIEYVLKPVSESELINAMRISVDRFERKEQTEKEDLSEKNRSWEMLEGKNILVVEDDLISGELIKRILKKRNIRYTVAVNGFEAMSFFKSQNFHAILMDIQLPGIDGIQVTEKIREMEKETKTYTPVVALTAHVGDEFINECIRAGMDGFISKPVNFGNLYDELVRIFSMKKKFSDAL
jgi:signal transduction histidine kinase/CheY-like chemotaxis protein